MPEQTNPVSSVSSFRAVLPTLEKAVFFEKLQEPETLQTAIRQ